ncbi:MAG TPA: sorbosone dehydrogenase family protein [Abditibacteriaceae bacterium]|nr:sorbosone dehydrogenase family protein [Abditibacteriaceae bacterium]
MRTRLFLLSALPVAAICIAGGCARSQAPEPGMVAAAGAAPTAPRQPGSTPIIRTEEVPKGVTGDSGLTVPRGFAVNVFAEGLDNPRRLVIAPGGTPQKYDVFVAESRPNRIRILRESNGGGSADARFTFTEKTAQPYGMAFHPDGWLYVGNTDSVVRFPYSRGATSTNSEPQEITRLTKGGYNQHWTRNLLFSRDSKKLYVTVGSSCNTCEETDPQRAAISVMNPDGTGRRLLASGLRNPVGMDWRPGTKELWTAVNERDRLGDDVPPDYLTLVKDGGFYGWPYAYTDIDGKIVPDPDFGEKNPAKVQQTTAPTVPVQAHSAALGVAFYPPGWINKRLPVGLKQFPPEYSGDAFLTFHGSWNRSVKTGYKVVRVDFENGRPVSVTDFVRGYLRDGQVWGRPVDVAVAPDGSLLFTDDGSGKVWRVSYMGKA